MRFVITSKIFQEPFFVFLSVMVSKTMENMKPPSSPNDNALFYHHAAPVLYRGTLSCIQPSVSRGFADIPMEGKNATLGNFKLARKDLLTQRHEVITSIQHHIPIQFSLFRAQMSPLVRRKDHSHVSKIHWLLKSQLILYKYTCFRVALGRQLSSCPK